MVLESWPTDTEMLKDLLNFQIRVPLPTSMTVSDTGHSIVLFYWWDELHAIIGSKITLPLNRVMEPSVVETKRK